MSNIIRIKRSTSVASPATLLNGEIAWSDASDTLFIGKAGSVVEIGGSGVFAKLNSPVFTGTPTAPTSSLTDSSLKLATTAFVKGQRLDQFVAPNLDVSFNSQKLTDLGAPTNPNDAATKAYVDATASGLDVKDSVRVATTADTSLSGSQTVDGIVLVAGDRVLVKNQATSASNGIYVVSSSAWTRATDYNSSAKASPGSFVFVEEGTTLADSGWVMNADSPITLDTTALTFTQFSGSGSYLASAPIVLSGNTFSLGYSANTLRVSGGDLQVGGGTSGYVLTSAGASSEATWGLVDLVASVTGTLPVANGGTGVATLTGLVKANGTSAFSAAVPDVDYLTPNSTIDGGTY